MILKILIIILILLIGTGAVSAMGDNSTDEIISIDQNNNLVVNDTESLAMDDNNVDILTMGDNGTESLAMDDNNVMVLKV